MVLVFTMKNKEVTIDGRQGEGGGQILRTALALSAVLNIPLRVNHIRGKRRKPGLRPQHLMAVTSLATITSAKVVGAEVGSTELLFEPEETKGGRQSHRSISRRPTRSLYGPR